MVRADEIKDLESPITYRRFGLTRPSPFYRLAWMTGHGHDLPSWLVAANGRFGVVSGRARQVE